MPDTDLHSNREKRLSTNLPLQLSSFVGREQAVAEVKRLLGEGRLLTLTGPGGCGKTRLALAAASELLTAFADGVWLVELAQLSDPALVPRALLSALGLGERAGRTHLEILTDHLRARELLLLLDNCEHLIAAAARLAEALLHHCPRLRILATSREALNLSGEIVWSVPPLS
ncbi:MAG: AAA family ATPase, partial [Ardenticatenaceae bacterium]